MPSPQVFWYPNPHQFDNLEPPGPLNPWDTCTLGGYTMPGITKMKGPVKGRKLDIKQSPGTHGATMTDQGYKPADVVFEVLIWTPAQAEAFQIALPAWEPAPGKEYSEPQLLIHPATSMRGITSVVIEEITGPEVDEKGVGHFLFKCKQFVKSNAVATHTPESIKQRNVAQIPNRAPDPASTPPAP
jgi:hypothetical protein